MAWLLGGLEGVFWPPHHTHYVRKGLGTCVTLDLPALLRFGWQSPQWLYWCRGQPASTLFVRTDSFSDENGVSLRLCNVQKLVLSGPCFADVNVEKVGLLSPNIWTFWWFFRVALQIFGRFVGPLCIVAEGWSLRHYVVLFSYGLRKLPFLMKYYCHGKYVLVNVCHVVVNL